MAASVASLERLGWYVTESGLKKLTGGKDVPEADVIKLAQDTDIKDFGKSHIPESWSKKNTVTVDGVLQVQKVRNVAAPKANEESQGAPRLLRVTLSDGVSTVTALEAAGGPAWFRLTLRTPPGTKLRLRGSLPVCSGFLLVPDAALQMIGGQVQLMVDKWLMAKAFASQQLRPATGGAGGPPPWVPFGKSISAAHKAERDFKSLGGGEEAPVDAEFEAQRRAQIAQLGGAGRKQFGGGAKQMTDGNLQTLLGAGFSQEEAEAALKHTYNDVGRALQDLQRFRARREGREGADGSTGRGRGRGRERRDRGRYEEEEGSGRPSESVTLLDFVGLKIGADNTGSAEHQSDSGAGGPGSLPPAPSGPRRDYGPGDGDRRDYNRQTSDRGDYDRRRNDQANLDRRGDHRRSYNGRDYDHRGNDSRGRGDYSHRGGRGGGGSGRGGGGDYTGGPARVRDGYTSGRDRDSGRDGDSVRDREAGPPADSVPRGGRGGPQRPHVSSDEFVEGRRAQARRRAAGGGEPRSSGAGYDRPSDDRRQFPELTGGDEKETPQHRYTEGEMCLARYWQDEQMYLARVISVGDATAVVNFVDYGEHFEEVLTSNMRPLGFEEEKQPAHQEAIQLDDSEPSETSSLFSHNRRTSSRRGREESGTRLHNGTEDGRANGGDAWRGDRRDTYRNDRGDTYRNDRGDTYRNNRGGNYRNDRGDGYRNSGGDDYRNDRSDFRGNYRDNYRNDRSGGHRNSRDDNHESDRGSFKGDDCGDTYRNGTSDTYRTGHRGGASGRGGRGRGGRGRGHYERPPRHQYQDGERSHGYEGDRPPEWGRGRRGGGGRGRGRYEEGGHRQWMDTAPDTGRRRPQAQEASEDRPFTGTMEFRRGGRRPFVSRGS